MAATTVREVPVEPALAEKLRRAAGRLERATADRDRLIVEARRAGASSREVAELVGLTHAGVLHIEKRAARSEG